MPAHPPSTGIWGAPPDLRERGHSPLLDPPLWRISSEPHKVINEHGKRAMTEPALIVISGAPGTGKTTMARQVATTLRIPYLGKDLIKESLFDSLGTQDRDWSTKLGIASIELRFKLIESHLEAGQSVVAEMKYRKVFDVPRFRRLLIRYTFKTVEIHCETDRRVLHTRLKQRDESGERHPGHETAQMIEVIDKELADGTYGSLALGGCVIRVDTTDFEQVNYDAIISAVGIACSLRAYRPVQVADEGGDTV